MTKGRTSVIRVGLTNLALRFLGSPVSFAFSYLVAHHLSHIDLALFGLWQSVFIYITGLFSVPSGALSSMISKFAAQGKAVGGLILLNLALGAVSGLAYELLQPFLIPPQANVDPPATALAIIMLITYYLLTSTNGIARGRTPTVIGVSTFAFQAVRFATVLVAFYLFKMTVLGVILAYSLGYLTQIVINLFFAKANLKVDTEVVKEGSLGALALSIAHIQSILEASLVWIANYLTQSTVPASYFESAVIVTNVITWSASLADGLIRRFAESRDPASLESVLRLYASAGILTLVIDLVGAHALLYYIRPEYVASVLIAVVLALSVLVRILSSAYYSALLILDETLGKSLKSPLTRMLVRNVVYASAILFFAALTLYALATSRLRILGFTDEPWAFGMVMALAMLGDSIVMVFNAHRTTRSLTRIKFPVGNYLRNSLAAFVVLVAMMPLSFVSSIWKALALVIVAGLSYLGLAYVLDGFTRTLLLKTVRELKNVIIRGLETT